MQLETEIKEGRGEFIEGSTEWLNNAEKPWKMMFAYYWISRYEYPFCHGNGGTANSK